MGDPWDELIEFEGFTFFKPSEKLPPIPPLRCCNGIHKGVGCDTEVVAYYPQVQKLLELQSELREEKSHKSPPKSLPLTSNPQPFQISPSTIKKRSSLIVIDDENWDSNEPVVKKSRPEVPIIPDDDFYNDDLWSIDTSIFEQSAPKRDSNGWNSKNEHNTSNTSGFNNYSFPSNSSLNNSLNLSSSSTRLPSNHISNSTKLHIKPNSTFNVPPTKTILDAQGISSGFEATQEIETKKKSEQTEWLEQRMTQAMKPSTSKDHGNLLALVDADSVDSLAGRNDMHGKFKAFLKDNTDQFSKPSLLPKELCFQMHKVFRDTFGFKQFRHCQLSVVVASLLGKNCCVLMPTGAGKSLCYQLTAVVSTGLTIVVSPLISLMTDQIAKLKSLKIQAESLRGDTPKPCRDRIFKDLNGDVHLKLLYVAPEMLSRSSALMGTLQRVHSRGKLSRIVVDEAHCISSWGHDFRPEYSRLPDYFADIQGVPVMALTATATPQAVLDIRQSLRVENSALFISSFVRSNLSYDVMPKSAANFRKLVDVLKASYPRSSGIIYCLSRQDCEDVAKQLNEAGLSALPYHAKLSNKTREMAQNKWMCNGINVICATIAFGMGIDKPDVRYVIHHSMSSSLESYYQETGRAGRDGLPSRCTLMYSFADHVRYLKLFQDSSGNGEFSTHRIQNLHQMMSYCENVCVCYRKMLVEHFGEFYDSKVCRQSRTPCTICMTKNSLGSSGFKAYDFTQEAVEVLKSVQQMKNATLKSVIDSYRGMEPKRGKHGQAPRKLSLHGRGEGCSEDDVKRFIHKLLIDGYLKEHLEYNRYAKVDIAHVKVSESGAALVRNGQPKFYSYMSVQRRKSLTSRLYSMAIVSESTVLKEKYKLKHMSVFCHAKDELKALIFAIACDEGGEGANPYNILSAEGIEQLAAMLPRTKSEVLEVDSMNADKYEIYGQRLMTIMQKYWNRIDELEHSNIKRTLNAF